MSRICASCGHCQNPARRQALDRSHWAIRSPQILAVFGDANDPSGRDFMDVVSLKKPAAFFQATERVPRKFNPKISAFQSIILKAIQGVAKKRTGPLRFGNWEVAERLGASDLFAEYRAFNIFTGPKAGHVRLRA